MGVSRCIIRQSSSKAADMSDSPESTKTQHLSIQIWGVDYDVEIPESKDPYEWLDELLVMMDVLCPQRPYRPPFTGREVFRL